METSTWTDKKGANNYKDKSNQSNSKRSHPNECHKVLKSPQTHSPCM